MDLASTNPDFIRAQTLKRQTSSQQVLRALRESLCGTWPLSCCGLNCVIELSPLREFTMYCFGSLILGIATGCMALVMYSRAISASDTTQFGFATAILAAASGLLMYYRKSSANLRQIHSILKELDDETTHLERDVVVTQANKIRKLLGETVLET